MITRDEGELPLPHSGKKGHVRESVDSEITGKDLKILKNTHQSNVVRERVVVDNWVQRKEGNIQFLGCT